MAKCVPGRNSSAHFLQTARKRNPETGPPEKTPGILAGFLVATCVPCRNSNAHLFQTALERNPGAVSPGKTPGFPAALLVAKYVQGCNRNAHFFQTALQGNPQIISRKKRPGSWRFLVAKCVPGRSSNLHFLQDALRKNPKAVPPENTLGFRGGFNGEMCTRPQFKFALSSQGDKKKPRGGFATKKNAMSPGFRGGEISTRSQFKFASSSGGAKKKNQRWRRRKNAARFRVSFFRRNLRHVEIQIRFLSRGR